MTNTGIYKITSPSGKVYIGQSWDIYKRLSRHKNNSDKTNYPLNRSITKYGYASHKFETVHSLPKDVSQSVMDNFEILYISLYRDAGFGLLNLKEGGSFGKHSEETKMKFRLNNIGKKHSTETKKRMSNTQKKRPAISETVKQKIANTLKGKKRPKEVIEKVRKSVSAYHQNNKISDETRVKRSENAKKMWSDADTRSRILLAHKNRPPVSDEIKLKISEGKKLSWTKKKNKIR